MTWAGEESLRLLRGRLNEGVALNPHRLYSDQVYMK